MGKERSRFDGVNDFFSEAARIRSYGVHGGGITPEPVERTYASAWVPAADIIAVGDDLLIRIELPGVDPHDIDLRLRGGVLTVSGTRAGEPEDTVFLSHERYWGEFRRSISLPESVEPDQITAEFSNGLVVLKVRGAVTEDGTAIELVDTSGPATIRGVDS